MPSILKAIALLSSPERDLMLADDLLNTIQRKVSDCPILEDSLAAIPCLGQVQSLIRTDWLEIISLV